MSSAPPVALTIAGSDNSAGAGAQADLKTFTALGIYGLTAITCVVAEVPGRVSAIQPIDAKIVREQIRLSFEAYPVAAVKTGMLHSCEIIEAVCEELEQRRPLLVVDPVMVATGGDALLKPDAVSIYESRLFQIATLVTPNLDETQTLLGRPISNVEEMREAGRELIGKFGVAFLIKGGHLRGNIALDLLFESGGESEFSAKYMRDVSTHGTGCTYSAAITAGFARGLALRESVAQAKRFVTRAIERYHAWGATHALDHGIS